MKNSYKCIFFDLDHTLWDYEMNSCATLDDLFHSYRLQDLGVHNSQSFQQQFKKVNTELWDLMERGMISSDVIRKERFKQILAYFTIEDSKLCEQLSSDYLYNCPKKGHLIPHALETLQYLFEKYSMTVVTNGFDEIQQVKLRAGDMHRYFKYVVTSQQAGHRKPSRGIFDFAMNANGVSAHEVIMIGDNLVTDIGGAIHASIDTVFFNPDKVEHTVNVKHEISSLAELRNIL